MRDNKFSFEVNQMSKLCFNLRKTKVRDTKKKEEEQTRKDKTRG